MHRSLATGEIMVMFRLPYACWGCQALLGPDSCPPHLCATCSLSIEPLEPQPKDRTQIFSLYVYQGVMAQLLTRLKFQGQRQYARPLGELLWGAPANPLRVPNAWSHIIPLPLHRRRQWRRGFNQCERILHWSRARVKKTEFCFPTVVDAPIVTRTRHGVPQRELSRQARVKNVSMAFKGERSSTLDPQASILVFDDVVTTGATLQAALDALRSAGYQRCAGLALMRAG